MLDKKICRICWDELTTENAAVSNDFSDIYWLCRVRGTYNAVCAVSTPPKGCLRLFEQALYETVRKKSKEENNAGS